MNPPPVTTAPTTAAFPHVSMSASLGGNARISISLAVVGVIIADHLAVLLILLGHGGGSNQGWERLRRQRPTTTTLSRMRSVFVRASEVGAVCTSTRKFVCVVLVVVLALLFLVIDTFPSPPCVCGGV